MMPSPPPHPFPGPAEPDTVPGPARTQVWFQPAEPVSVYEQLLQRRIVLANGHLTDETATRLCAQLLTLDAGGDDPIRFELQNLGADLTAAITVMGVLDTVGVPVRARVAGRIADGRVRRHGGGGDRPRGADPDHGRRPV
jgi:hypothetical protein